MIKYYKFPLREHWLYKHSANGVTLLLFLNVNLGLILAPSTSDSNIYKFLSSEILYVFLVVAIKAYKSSFCFTNF